MSTRRPPRCSPRHGRHCSYAHEALVIEYRDARDAREALRESDYYSQHEADDFAREVAPVTFKDWLIEYAARNRAPESE